MYSQNDEEAVIAKFFQGRTGRFLDIGAHDGVRLSNTRRLAENGWGGTLVEPSPGPFSALMDAYKGRDDVKLIHAAVLPESSRGSSLFESTGPHGSSLFESTGSHGSSLFEFHDSRGDFVSTFEQSQLPLWRSTEFQKIYVAGVTVADLLKTAPGPYDFITLDVEGINHLIFRELPLAALGTKLVCVEHQNRFGEVEEYARSQGLPYILRTNAENAIFGDRSA